MAMMRERILAACFERYEGTFANGEKANNKLDGEKIRFNHVLRPMVVRRIGKMVLAHNPDFVVAVPSGANWLAKDIAETYDIGLVRLMKNPKNRQKLMFRTHAERAELEKYEKGVLIEDVINRFTNTRKVLALPGMFDRIIAEVAVWDRGLPEQRTEPGIPYEALIVEPIPAMLPVDSELWSFASETAEQ